MKSNSFVLVFIFAFVLTCSASAQEIKPRGFDTPTETTTETAEAVSEETPMPTESATESAEPATTKALEDRLAHAENRLDGLYAWAEQEQDRLKKLEVQPEPREPAVPVSMYILMAILFAIEGMLFFGKAGKGHEHEAEPRPQPQPQDEPDYDNRRGGPGAAFVLCLLGIGMLASSAQAECKIVSISTGSVIVKEQAAAPITITLKGCDKDVEAIQAAASGVTFTDVSSAKDKVTAKVTANASALTGPTAIKVSFSDDTDVISGDNVFALVLDTATATIRKDAVMAKNEASSARKEVRALSAKVDRVAQDVAARSTINEVQALEERVAERVAELERELDYVRAAQVATDERLFLLGRATELLAEGQALLGRRRVGLFRRPLNSSVAASADKVREALVPSPVVEAADN